MERMLEVLNSLAAGQDDDVSYAWAVAVNDVVLRVVASTRQVFPTRDEAWAGALALREALVGAVGEPRTDETIKVQSDPSGGHLRPDEFKGYRGAVELHWPVAVHGETDLPG